MRNVFEKQLDRELLRTEKKRTLIIIFIFLVATGYRLVDFFFLSPDPETLILESNLTVWLFPPIIIGFELFTLLVIERRLRVNGKKIPLHMQFVNTALEICLPSMIILSVARQLPGYDILKSPALYIYFIFIILSTLRLNFALSFFCGLLSSAAYVMFRLLIAEHFNSSDGGRAVILILSGVAAGLVARQIRQGINRSMHEAEKRQRVENLFGQQISAEIAGKMLENGGMVESRRMQVTVMFIDIRNFTRFVSGKSPEEIVNYQNDFLNIVINCVTRHGGIVNQILGDGCMVTFGAPIEIENAPKKALAAAREILRELESASHHGQINPTRVGIGIHTGEAITGNIGTESRKQYSITGSVVILASRIEQLNKEFQSQLLISEEVFHATEWQEPGTEIIPSVSLKGFDNPMNIYKVA